MAAVILAVGAAAAALLLACADSDDERPAGLATVPLEHGFAFQSAVAIDDERVLITGGRDEATDEATTSAFLLDTRSGELAALPPMQYPRAYHTSTRLESGDVLLVGGAGAEIFSPSTNEFREVGSPNTPRFAHAAALLGDGSVLIAGGQAYVAATDYFGAALASAERFDPATGQFTEVEPTSEPKVGATALDLPSGDVAIVGGDSIELFSLTEGRFLDPVALTGMRDPAAGVLPDGTIVLVGGWSTEAGATESFPASAMILVFDPDSGDVAHVGDLQTERGDASLAVLDDGRVVVSGGSMDSHFDSGLLDSVEIITPGAWTSELAATMSEARFDHSSVVSGGSVVLVGSPTRSSDTTIDIFTP